ncbi:MAG: hypothetical protein EPN21_01225 [Methylococcaceae bacterium]|nr:MAG: hypothetical protein EPN21_01225 [Methylococcaceae bacterium]
MPKPIPPLLLLITATTLSKPAIGENFMEADYQQKMLLENSRRFVQLYLSENASQLAYIKGPDKQKALARYEYLQALIHKQNAKPNQPVAGKLLEALLSMELANAKHSLESLLDLEAAKNILEQCCIDAITAENAVAHALLGYLYFKVPPDPLSFGDKERGLQHLQKALEIDPEGAWPNYYYGIYLKETQQPLPARRSLERAVVGRIPAGLSGIEVVIRRDTEEALKLFDHATPDEP